MHCFYDAWLQYRRFLQLPPDTQDYDRFPYEALRKLAGCENEFTYGGVVPCIAAFWALKYNRLLTVEYHPSFDKAYYFDGATEDEQFVMNSSLFRLDLPHIQAGPGMYCLLAQKHTVFWSEWSVPDGVPVMAIKMSRV